MTNHVSYHSRTRLLRKLEDLIEIGKYDDFTSPYVVFLPQDTINLCLQSSILNLNNEVVRAKDFYRSYGYISSKSISRILAQLMTGVRDSLSFSRGYFLSLTPLSLQFLTFSSLGISLTSI